MPEYEGNPSRPFTEPDPPLAPRHPILDRIEHIENVLREISPESFSTQPQYGSIPQPLQIEVLPQRPQPLQNSPPLSRPMAPEAEPYHPELEDPELILHGTRSGWTFIRGARTYHYVMNGQTLCKLHFKRGEFIKKPTPDRGKCCKGCVTRVSQKVKNEKKQETRALIKLHETYPGWENIPSSEMERLASEVIEKVRKAAGPPLEEDLPFATTDDFRGRHSSPITKP